MDRLLDRLREWIGGNGFVAGQIGALVVLAVGSLGLITRFHNWELAPQVDLIVYIVYSVGFALPGLLASMWLKPADYKQGAKLGALSGVSGGMVILVASLLSLVTALALFGGEQGLARAMGTADQAAGPEMSPLELIGNTALSEVYALANWALMSAVTGAVYGAIVHRRKEDRRGTEGR